MTALVLLLEDLLAPFGALATLLYFAFSRRRKVLLGLGDELRERLGGGAAAAAQPVIWVHCASAGEVNAAAPLLQRLAARPSRPGLIVTTLTSAGREKARALGFAARLAPLDAWPFFHRFLNRLEPRLLVLVETELWPHMIELTARRAPVVLVNARVSDRSFPRYRLARPLLAPFLRRLSRVCAQSERDADRLRALGAPAGRVRPVGNLKLDVAAAAPALEQARRAVSALGWDGLPVFVAGSTHPGEEEAVVAAFLEARSEFPALRLVAAPRHVERAAQTLEALRAKGLKTASWSRLEESSAADVLVLDTLGALGSFYPLAALSFVGGTLVPVGGHSVLEPALAGSFVCFGPHVQNTLEPARLLESAGGALTVDDAPTLAQALKEALRDPARAKGQGEIARKTAERLRGAADRTLKELEDVLAAAGL